MIDIEENKDGNSWCYQQGSVQPTVNRLIKAKARQGFDSSNNIPKDIIRISEISCLCQNFVFLGKIQNVEGEHFYTAF